MIVIILILCIIISVGIGYYFVNKTKLDYTKANLEESKNTLIELNRQVSLTNAILKSLKDEETKLLSSIASAKAKWENLEELSRKGFEVYSNGLLKSYEEKEKEYNLACDNLNASYEMLQDNVLEEQKQLEQLRNIRYSIVAAGLESKKEQQQKDYYRLITPLVDTEDIDLLTSIKDKLHNSALVLKVIWSQFRQKQLKELFTKILGDRANESGIYKITNLITDEVYVGQATHILDRWTQHAKNACGVGNTTAGALYKSMQQYGLDNFTWEVLEFCPIEELNEKEKAYIKIYCAKEYGLNGTVGGS